jgi:GDP-L-fucose synthase
MNKKTLVTGGSGLVGSYFDTIDKRKKYDTWNSSYCDLRNKSLVEKKLKSEWYNGIIHTAAKVGGVGGNMKYKGEFFYDNIMMNTNIIEVARKEGIENLVCFLSTCVFPNDVEYPLTEKKIHLGPPHFSNDAYAYAKRMADVQIRAYREQYGLNYKSVIPTNIYGINDNFDIENGHVIPSLIHKCYVARETKTPLTIWGSGKPLREFINSKDVGKLTEWVLENYNEDEPIILSTSEEVSIKNVVGIIIELMNFKGEVKWDSDKPDGQYRKPSDNSKIKHYLPNFEFTPLYDGLRETITWFEDNYERVRGTKHENIYNH